MYIVDKLTELINRWDPTKVMSHAPDDEYELEIGMIKQLLEKTEDPRELANGIQNIFLETCGVEFFHKSFEECLEISKEIIDIKNTL